MSSSMLNNLDGDEFIWSSPDLQSTPLTTKIQNYEQSALHCFICHQFFTNAVTLRPCNHVFCSECIRKALREGNKIRRMHNCPICKKEVKGKEENYLVPNWGLQVAVDSYREMRSMLHCSIQQGQMDAKAVKDLTMGSESKKNVEKDYNYSHKSSKADINVLQRVGQGRTEEESPPIKRARRNCRLSHSTYKEDQFNAGENESDKDEDFEINERASLKVISQSIKTNSTPSPHSTGIGVETQSNQKMKRMPPFRFHGTKKTQLIRWCKDHGLPNNGSDDDRKWRLKNYADLWNAECDAMKPRTKKELVKVLRSREQSEKQASIHTNYNDKIHLAKLKDSRKEIGSNNNGSSVATSGSTSYDEKMKDGFRNLIAQLKSRQNGTKCKAEDLTKTASLSLENDHTPKMTSLLNPKLKDDCNLKVTPSEFRKTISSTKSSSQPMSKAEISEGRKAKQTVTNTHPFVSVPAIKATESMPTRRKYRTPPTCQTKSRLWECKQCTFRNEAISWSRTKQSCKMCGALRVENEEKIASFVKIDY